VDRADLGDRQGLYRVQQRGGDGAQRREDGLRLGRCPEVGHSEVGDEPAAQIRGDRVEVGEGDEGDRQAQFVGSHGCAPAEGGEQAGCRVAGEEQPAAVQGVDGHEVDLQLGGDAEIAAAAPDGPEQVGLGVCGDVPHFACGSHDPQPPDPVGAVAVPASEQAEAAAKGIGHGADVGCGPAQRGKPQRSARPQHGCPRGACADGGGAAGRIDGGRRHGPGVDQQAAMDARDRAVAGRPDRHGQSVIGCEAHRGRHVGLLAGADRHVGGGNGGQVKSGAGHAETGGARLMDPAGQYVVEGGEAAGHGSPVNVGAARAAGGQTIRLAMA
jgi:hypothetical protein